MVQILYVRVASPETHESHITDVRWYNPETGDMNVATVAAMVDFIANKHGKAYTCDGRHIRDVEVVQDGNTTYIRSRPDFITTDNLLALPRF